MSGKEPLLMEGMRMTEGQILEEDMGSYVRYAKGINTGIRGQILLAFQSDNARTEITELIWHSAEELIEPEARGVLKGYLNPSFF